MKALGKTSMKGWATVVLVLGIFLLLIQGCRIKVIPEEEQRSEVNFTIISDECIPKSLEKLIENRKEKGMKLTYMDQGKRYIVVGYGEQKSGGYSIYIKDLYKTVNAVYVDTCLVGPDEKEENKDIVSYPKIVLQISEIGLPVVFQ